MSLTGGQREAHRLAGKDQKGCACAMGLFNQPAVLIGTCLCATSPCGDLETGWLPGFSLECCSREVSYLMSAELKSLVQFANQLLVRTGLSLPEKLLQRYSVFLSAELLVCSYSELSSVSRIALQVQPSLQPENLVLNLKGGPVRWPAKEGPCHQNMSLIPGPHRVEGENRLLQVVL